MLSLLSRRLSAPELFDNGFAEQHYSKHDQQYGEWDEEDSDVYEGERHVGRIMRHPQARKVARGSRRSPCASRRARMIAVTARAVSSDGGFQDARLALFNCDAPSSLESKIVVADCCLSSANEPNLALATYLSTASCASNLTVAFILLWVR